MAGLGLAGHLGKRLRRGRVVVDFRITGLASGSGDGEVRGARVDDDVEGSLAADVDVHKVGAKLKQVSVQRNRAPRNEAPAVPHGLALLRLGKVAVGLSVDVQRVLVLCQ